MKHLLRVGSVLSTLHRIHLLALTPTVLVWEDRADKSLQPGWLKTTEIYSLAARRARRLKSGCQHGCVLSQGSKKESFLAPYSFWGVAAVFGVPWLVDAPLPLLSLTLPRGVLPVYLPVFVSPLLMKTPVILDQEPTPNQHHLILTNYTCEGLTSKEDHVLRFHVVVNVGGLFSTSYTGPLF